MISDAIIISDVLVGNIDLSFQRSTNHIHDPPIMIGPEFIRLDVTLVCENGNSKLVEVVTGADVDDGNSLLQIWKLCLIIKQKFCSDFEYKVWSRF